jgi:Pregnancy-associated plasma protein-A
MKFSITATALTALLFAGVAQAQRQTGPGGGRIQVQEEADGTIVAADALGTSTYFSWGEFFNSPFFRKHKMRCGKDMLPSTPINGPAGTKSDCTMNTTDPKAEYDPSVAKYCIPVVVHVIEHSNGNGAISDAMVQSQIDVLNEDFLALAGSNGSPGTDVQVEFALATVDPQGNPTTGIERHVNNNWYNDSGNYQSQISWDTCRYLNIYTNTASGYLGYAYMPNGGGVVCQSFDGVVINWTAFGKNSPGGPPYNQGRTATHEVGHYLGLFHTFDGGCGTNNCYNTGDLICDTEKEKDPRFGCPANANSCNVVDPIRNYMDYTDDLCMWEFTPEQARRIRCTIENWRPQLYTVCGGGGQTLLFSDDFESANFTAGGWTISSAARCLVKKQSSFGGIWGAKLKKGGVGTGACTVGTDETWIVSPSINTTGYTAVEVRMDAHFRKQEIGCEWMDVQYSIGGGGWNTVGQVDAHQWAGYVFPLPAAAAGVSDLRIRMITNAKGARERAELDNFRVFGS